MNNERKLELTLCGMLPYDLKVNAPFIATTDESIRFLSANIVSQYFSGERNIIPLLHSLDKLTEPILDGGFIPLVELAKMTKNEYSYSWVVTSENICECEFYKFTYRNGSFFLKDSFYRAVENQLSLFQKLKEWHFNIYDLPSDMYIEKSTVNL